MFRSSDPERGGAAAQRGSRRPRTLGLICAAVALAMVGAAFAAVPLYKAFCQATGFDGTVRRATKASATQISRTVTVDFDTTVRGVPWDFQPEKRSIDLKLGATGIAYFKVTNTSDQPVTARAVYN